MKININTSIMSDNYGLNTITKNWIISSLIRPFQLLCKLRDCTEAQLIMIPKKIVPIIYELIGMSISYNSWQTKHLLPAYDHNNIISIIGHAVHNDHNIITCHQGSDGRWGTQMDVYIEGMLVSLCKWPIEGCMSHYMKHRRQQQK